MRQRAGNGSEAARQQLPRSALRDRLAGLLALATVACVGAALVLSKGTQLLMPGPLTSAHGTIEACSACHTRSGSGKMSWIHGLVAGDRRADSKACLACHKMADTAFNAHGASSDVLKQSTLRLAKLARETPQPPSARAQSIAFPTDAMVTQGLSCATCHQEHQGVDFDLARISSAQCRSCHVMKFDSFDGHHPKFERYPFKRRTRIIYDHAGHFGKHYPEVAKKDPARRIPETCSTCHTSRDDRRVMAVAPFEQTCSGCHLNQIVGKERVSGPKGVAFLSLPGLDLETLKKKKAAIGEWPDASEAALTPFMKVMIARDERGRALVKAVDSLNLQDLATASDGQIAAVTALVWEIKRLFHALVKGKASDVLAELTIGGTKLGADAVADLTASLPRDVVAGAQQQWLPNLAAEMASRPAPSDRQQSGWNAVIRQSRSEGPAPSGAAPGSDTGGGEAAMPQGAAVKTYTTNAGPEDDEEAPAGEDGTDGTVGARQLLPSGTPRAIEAARAKDAEKAARPERSKAAPAVEERRGVPEDADKPPQPGAETDAASSKADDGGAAASAERQPPGKAVEQTDDLLFPTEAELRAIKAGAKTPGQAAQPEGAAAKADVETAGSDAGLAAGAASKAGAKVPAEAEPRARAAPAAGIDSDVDAESWAEYGGWYRQDYAIFYRPTGHKDKFITTWVRLTGPYAPKGDTGAAAAVFDALTGKDAQGACTKCHSVDDVPGQGRLVNFSPPSTESKRGRFTNFVHEPHFGLLEPKGCLACHGLEKGSPYLKSYEQGNPLSFASNFSAVKKDLCQGCHTTGMARQDCLLCHSYHVDGAITPIMSTKLPSP